MEQLNQIPSTPASDVLKSIFGYSHFRGDQADIIQSLIDGRDAVVLMPTGGGKSLCYQIPSLVREGTGIVISPLIALMEDQVSALSQLGVKAAYLNSSLDAQTAFMVEQQLIHGELDILYVAPERLVTQRFLNCLAETKLALFAIDEAHCVSQWGHDFRPDYIQLSILQQQFPDIPRIALTATADETTRAEIITRLGLEEAGLFVAGFDRPNICYRISQAQGNARDALLRFIREEHREDAGIVYCLSRKKVEQTADWLSVKGLKALPYHAGLSTEVRRHNQQQFLNDDAVIIVATIAFGMGIDKPDVRFVAHLNLPKSLEAYYQETGRAGRDGTPANAWMMYGLQDVISLRQMMATSEANEQHKRVEHHKLDAMLGFSELTSCRRQALLAYFGDHMDAPCGNCDSCLTPAETWDATEVSRQALSTVYRTGQRFGVNYLTDVLLGKDTVRIQQFGHKSLSVFGIGQSQDATQWRNIFRQLIAHSFLTVDLQGHGGLRLTEQSRPLLRGEQQLMLRKLPKASKKAASNYRKKSGQKDISKADETLWEALRECRRTLSKEMGVPPYVIFHDATLMEMVNYQPLTSVQLLNLSGVGEHKLEQYGEPFLAVIQTHFDDIKSLESAGGTVDETLQLFRCGFDVAAIAAQRSITKETVYSHLAKSIAEGDIPLTDVVDLTLSQINTIQDTIMEMGEEGAKLKPVYEALDGVFDYALIRCVRAAMSNE